MEKNILVIDDESVIRKSFELTFENAEFKIDTAVSGLEGIEKLKSGSYALVFLDLKMPELDGIETLRKIRDFNKKTKVYIFTAFHKDYMARLDKAADEGLNFEIFLKPLDGHTLMSLVESAFK